MGKGMYAGDASGKARKVKQAYLGVANVAQKIKKMYIGDASGKARLCFSGGVDAGEVIFTSSQIWTVPDGVTTVAIFCVGGGGGAGGGYTREWSTTTQDVWIENGGSSGAGGYTVTEQVVTVTPYENLSIVVGSGGIGGDDYFMSDGTQYGTAASTSAITAGTVGGASQVLRGSDVLCMAAGGSGGRRNTSTSTSKTDSAHYVNGVDGGSGSGVSESIYGRTNFDEIGVRGGSQGRDGRDGGQATQLSDPWDDVGIVGKGQGTTTRYFGESGGTLYSTAGANSPAANTGDGGAANGQHGASGIVIIRWAEQ